MDLKKFPRSAIFNLKNWLFEFYQTIYYYSTRNISLDVSKKIPIARKMIILYWFLLEHPMYTCLPLCGRSFHRGIVWSSSWTRHGRGMTTIPFEERNYFTPRLPPVKHVSSRTNSVVIIARKATPSSLHVEIVLVYNRYTRNWNNTFLTANCRTITLQSGIKAVTHTHIHRDAASY